MKKALCTIAIIIMLIILFVSGVILLNSIINPEEVPSFFGWKPFIVLSGSMETEIYAGDVVVVKEVDEKEVKEEDIIAFKEENVVITHRIVDTKEVDGKTVYYTKGDNNDIVDANTVSPEQIEGIYKFKITGLGNAAMFIQTPTGILACLSIPLGLLIIMQIISASKEKKQRNEEEKENKRLQKEIEKLREENKELSKK